jgi:formamidopyrimidine-DNA glycosylase
LNKGSEVTMPELPEVETVKETLKPKLLKRRILSVDIHYPGTIEYPTPEEFQKKIINQNVNDLTRRGKWIIIELDDYFLLSHLRMEGKYFFKTEKDTLSKHEHIIFKLDNNTELRYHDVRKFGKMWLIEKDKINEIGPLKELGLEPWDKNLTPTYLKEKFQNKKLPIKSLILDQGIITGIGNIYANEILFMSKINPLTKASDLTTQDLQNIIDDTKKELSSAIKKGGTTIKSYTSVDGVHGLFQQELLVHGKENENCPNCGTTIVKIKVGGRGTYYCPNCQKEK